MLSFKELGKAVAERTPLKYIRELKICDEYYKVVGCIELTDKENITYHIYSNDDIREIKE